MDIHFNRFEILPRLRDLHVPVKDSQKACMHLQQSNWESNRMLFIAREVNAKHSAVAAEKVNFPHFPPHMRRALWPSKSMVTIC